MQGKRWELLKITLKKVAHFALQLNPKGIYLHFLNGDNKAEKLNCLTAEATGARVGNITVAGGTYLGRELRKGILEPLVFQIAEKRDKPLIVAIITDGEVR